MSTNYCTCVNHKMSKWGFHNETKPAGGCDIYLLNLLRLTLPLVWLKYIKFLQTFGPYVSKSKK